MLLWLSLPDDPDVVAAAAAAAAATASASAVSASPPLASSATPGSALTPKPLPHHHHPSSSSPRSPPRPASALVDLPRGPGARVFVPAYDDLPDESALGASAATSAAAMAHLSAEDAAKQQAFVVFRQLSKVGLRLRVTPQGNKTTATHFILIVNMQPAEGAAGSATTAAAADGAAPTPSPATAAQQITSFPLHVNLGYALAQ